MKKISKKTALTLFSFMLTLSSFAQDARLKTLVQSLNTQLKTPVGLGGVLCFAGGIFFLFQGEEGQSKAKWAFGAALMALVIYFAFEGICYAFLALL